MYFCQIIFEQIFCVRTRDIDDCARLILNSCIRGATSLPSPIAPKIDIAFRSSLRDSVERQTCTKKPVHSSSQEMLHSYSRLPVQIVVFGSCASFSSANRKPSFCFWRIASTTTKICDCPQKSNKSWKNEHIASDASQNVTWYAHLGQYEVMMSLREAPCVRQEYL